ncbi:hypothetical protein D3C81_1290320 [compost metagenome]
MLGNNALKLNRQFPASKIDTAYRREGRVKRVEWCALQRDHFNTSFVIDFVIKKQSKRNEMQANYTSPDL